ncbi:Multidrug resistance protein stp [Micromonospora sp. MW-13]|uniref:MFS transporter n=1 Tax=Micromonospora sp. MW-13 TaxID=2094022 RepID=UPI000EEA9389|nr:MFS transporter [Micromonospora sp. MW-13]RGC68822.1 Multidrug resistance protein stp [Micromonospora sp. MW-13]
MVAEQSEGAGGRRTAVAWAVVAIVLLGDLLDLLDALVTTIAGPSIVRDVGGGPEFLQWLAAGYTLAMAAGLLVGARLGDIYGRKTMFLIGISGFTGASLICAIAGSPELLIAARVAQGLLGSMMVPQALGLIRQSFPPERVGVAFGLTGPILALGGVGGPILAGWLVDANYFGWGWRMIFAVNVPIGILLIVAAALVLPRSEPDRGVGLDPAGASLAAAGMAAIIFALVHGREFGWAWWIFAILMLGIAALAAFGIVQRRRATRRLATLIAPTLFAKPAFVGGLAFGALFFGAVMGTALLIAFYFQLGMGMTPLQAGLAAAPQAVGMIAGFVLSQILGLSRRTMRLGLAAIAVGFMVVACLTGWAAGDVQLWQLLPFLGLVGAGMGLAIAPYFDIVLAGVDEPEVGSASGSLTAMQQLGNAFGVAVLGSIFFGSVGPGAVADTSAYSTALAGALALSLLLIILAAVATTALPRRARIGHEATDVEAAHV